MIFKLPDLDYSKSALAPIMSEETLDLHHGKHHQTYITNLNKFIESSDMSQMTLEEIIIHSSKDKSKSGIFNNASQHWNHMQFWEMMGPDGAAMPSELDAEITDSFGSVDAFKTAFCAAGAGQFGAGWCWLVKNADGGLEVTKTENGVNPLCFGQTALLGCDVWEHSYYIDFRNKRPGYLSNFLDKLVNWDNVASRM